MYRLTQAEHILYALSIKDKLSTIPPDLLTQNLWTIELPISRSTAIAQSDKILKDILLTN